MGLPRLAVLVLFALCQRICQSTKSSPTRFLIVSTPRHAKIAYMRIEHGRRTRGLVGMQTLVSTGLAHPQGLAVDQKRGRLFVADPDSRQILSYPLTASGTTLTAGQPTVAVANTEARWVAVDSFGNIVFSDETRNQILKVRAGKLGKDTTPEVVHDGMTMVQVSAPGGVAADAFHAYWVNKQTGTQVGSLIQASSRGQQTDQHAAPRKAKAAMLVQTLSSNTDKSYGVCLAPSSIYFTQPESTIYGVKKSGGAAKAISDKLRNPRGCAWDGDGTVYVADRGANAIYSFPGNMHELSTIELTKTIDFEDAFGVAVFSGAIAAHLPGRLVSTLLALAISVLAFARHA